MFYDNIIIKMSLSIIFMYSAIIGFFTKPNVPPIIWIGIAFYGAILNISKYKLLKMKNIKINRLILIDTICELVILIVPMILKQMKLHNHIFNLYVYFIIGIVSLFIIKFNRKIIRNQAKTGVVK